MGDNIDNVGNLEAGALYMIKTYSGQARYLTNNSGKLVLSTTSTPSPKNIFLFHRNDTRAGGVSANYRNVCAGAWLNLYAYTDGEGEADGFIKEDLTFGPESEAAYMTCANGWNSASSNDIDLYLENTGQFFYYNGNNLYWGIYGNYYTYKWVIYKVTVE